MTGHPIKPIGIRRSCTNAITRALVKNFHAVIWTRRQGPWKHIAPQEIPARFVLCTRSPLNWLRGYAEYLANFHQGKGTELLKSWHKELVETLVEGTYITKHRLWLDVDLEANPHVIVRQEDLIMDEEREIKRVANALGLPWPPPNGYEPLNGRIAPGEDGRETGVEIDRAYYLDQEYLDEIPAEHGNAAQRALNRKSCFGEGQLLDRLGYGTSDDAFL